MDQEAQEFCDWWTGIIKNEFANHGFPRWAVVQFILNESKNLSLDNYTIFLLNALHYSAAQNTIFVPLDIKEVDSHIVSWMKYAGINIYDEPYEGEDLYCECDFEFKIDTYTDSDGNKKQRTVRTSDSFHCEAKQKVREQVKAEAREKYGYSWKKMGKKRAVYNIFRRVQRREWLGQRYPSIIYVQEVADLLEKDFREILIACGQLFEEEKMDLNGYILAPYVKRFRFPKEIQTLFRWIIEEPLGWPNGDAGDGFLYNLENAVHENTEYKHGKDVFEPSNYPHLAVDVLFNFGMQWIRYALERSETSEKGATYLRPSSLADMPEYFEQFAERCRELMQENAEKTVILNTSHEERYKKARSAVYRHNSATGPGQFHFPLEVQILFAYISGKGSSAEILAEIENAIHENTGYTSGVDAFYKENFMLVAPHNLLNFGLRWIHTALKLAENSKEALNQLLVYSLNETIPEHLDQFAARCRELQEETDTASK